MKSLMKRLHSEKLVGIGELSSLQYILIAGQYCDIAFSKDTKDTRTFHTLKCFNTRYVFTDKM